jgi:hypothetical protein
LGVTLLIQRDWREQAPPKCLFLPTVTVLLLNAIIGFSIEWRASQAVNALHRETVALTRILVTFGCIVTPLVIVEMIKKICKQLRRKPRSLT